MHTGLDLVIHTPMLKFLGLQVHTTKLGWERRFYNPGGGWVNHDASRQLSLSYVKNVDEKH